MRSTLVPYDTRKPGDCLKKVAQHIADGFGIEFQVTSHVRTDSLTHTRGDVIDIAPRLPPESDYAGNRGSDPLLSYRMPLIKELNSILKTAPYSGFVLVENNHFHVMLGKWRDKGSRWRVAVQKDMRYPDSQERAASYMLRCGEKRASTDYMGHAQNPYPNLPMDTSLSVEKGRDGHWSAVNIDHSYLLQ